MSKTVRYLLIFVVFDLVVAAGYFLFVKGGGGAAEESAWVTIDAAYVPKDEVEEFIKTDAANRDALPVQIRDYGSDARVLKRFKGRQFAAASENVLKMFHQGLTDWKIVDIRYKSEKEREVTRTVLYVFVKGQWLVGDTGSLVQ